MTMTNKVKSNVVINIILIIIYVYFFGQHSLKRFLDKSVIITEHEEMQELIDPPVITIQPLNSPETGQLANGWKSNDGLKKCSGIAFGEQFIKCVEDYTYSASDTNTSAVCPSCNSSDVATLSLFYQADFYGIVQSLKIKRGVISLNESDTGFVLLNKNVSYSLIISDPKMQLWMANPHAIPRTYLYLEASAGMVFVYLKAIRHEKLNRPHKPCQPSPDYNFADCVERSIIARVGCQPPWRRITVDEIPLCLNYSMLHTYGRIYEYDYGKMSKEKLIETSKCLMPCTYMEYEMRDDLEVIKGNITLLSIVFASTSVLVLKEEEAFTFGSLVADCGGVLGLFIGFNFLMVWDWLVWDCVKFCRRQVFMIRK